MPRRKAGEEGIRNLQKSGPTYTMSIPIHIIRELEWREHQKVVVTKSGNGFKVVDWKPKSPKKKK